MRSSSRRGLATYFGKTARLVEEAKNAESLSEGRHQDRQFPYCDRHRVSCAHYNSRLCPPGKPFDNLQFALVLTVAGIPVALPAVLSVTMAVGAIALAKKEAIVSKLVAIEEMAGVDILCSDKTGTITKNELTLADVRPLEGFTASDVLLFGSLASRAEDRDP